MNALVVQDAATVVLGIANAFYFLHLLRDGSLRPARRLGAAALATISMGILAQGAYFLLRSTEGDGWEGLALLGTRFLTLAGATFISLLILRQHLGPRNGG